MGRVTQTIGPATAAARVPESALDVERAALAALADLDDATFVEVEIKEPRATRGFLPVGYLRQYLAAQFVPGREVLMFDSDEEVTAGVAASMLEASRAATWDASSMSRRSRIAERAIGASSAWWI